MPEKEYADLIPILKHLCFALQPSAAGRNIKLDFTTVEKEIKIAYPESEILSGFTKSYFTDH
ncbi:MAG: hypothetical protein ABIN93_14115 [Ginsengibacter sp.]